jgi:hypothetical protein
MPARAGTAAKVAKVTKVSGVWREGTGSEPPP